MNLQPLTFSKGAHLTLPTSVENARAMRLRKAANYRGLPPIFFHRRNFADSRGTEYQRNPRTGQIWRVSEKGRK